MVASDDEESESETMLRRTASALVGIGDASRAPTREDLLGEGVPEDQVDGQLTQQHMDEIIRHRCMYVLMVSCCLMFIMVVFMLLGFIMCFAAYLETPDVSCDVPLRLWFKVLCANTLFNLICNQTSPRTGVSIGQQIFCCYTPPETGQVQQPGQQPLRVRFYVILNPLVQIAWCAVGLYWVTISGTVRAPPGSAGALLEPCYEVEPHLYRAIRFYAILNLIFWFCMVFAGIGFVTIFRALLLRGVFSGLRPAPAGSIERNTELVPQGDARLAPSPTCPVCMEAWVDDKERIILATKTCGHCFHKDCLQHWLGINRTCPLCRNDLGVGDPEQQV